MLENKPGVIKHKKLYQEHIACGVVLAKICYIERVENVPIF